MRSTAYIPLAIHTRYSQSNSFSCVKFDYAFHFNDVTLIYNCKAAQLPALSLHTHTHTQADKQTVRLSDNPFDFAFATTFLNVRIRFHFHFHFPSPTQRSSIVCLNYRHVTKLPPSLPPLPAVSSKSSCYATFAYGRNFPRNCQILR